MHYASWKPQGRHQSNELVVVAAMINIGITDVEVIPVEGIAFGPEVAQQAVGAALARAEVIAP